jgi:hypothetical protein
LAENAIFAVTIVEIRPFPKRLASERGSRRLRKLGSAIWKRKSQRCLLIGKGFDYCRFANGTLKFQMTPAEFKRKWARYSGKETAAYQEHFNDLCALLGQPSPATADPTGSESFCFQKRVVKEAELFALTESARAEEAEAERERGFADVWKKGCFAWEYKGKKKNLDAAYQQLLRYRESLLNPPLLVVCDFDRYIIRTNFNGTVQETREFTNANIDEPQVLHLLRAVFTMATTDSGMLQRRTPPPGRLRFDYASDFELGCDGV